jgi:hypothetical protein
LSIRVGGLMPPPGGAPPRRRPPGPTGGGPVAKTGGAPRGSSAVGKAVAKSPGAVLLCTSGPAEGQVFPLGDDEVVIGRSSENGVAVADTSVSRKHALLRRTPAGWAISDLGSGNGTQVNGEIIADETPLRFEDSIGVGDSEFTFAEAPAGGVVQAPNTAPNTAPDLDPAPRTTGVRRPPVRTTRALGGTAQGASHGRPLRAVRHYTGAQVKLRRVRFRAIGAVLVVLLAAALGKVAIDRKRRAQSEEIERGRREQLAVRAALLQQATNLTREGKWSLARSKLEELQQIDREYETARVAAFLKRVETESGNQKFLVEATAAVKQRELTRAARLLDSVKSDNAKTNASQGSIRGMLDEVAAQKLDEAKELLKARGDLQKMQAVVALCDDVLGARADDREAIDLRRLADQNMVRIQNPGAGPPPKEDESDKEVQARFRSGDLAGARALAESCGARSPACKRLLTQMTEYESKSRRLDSLKDDELIVLFDLDRKLAGGSPSELSKPIRTRVAAKFYLCASNAKTTSNWSRAIECARRVLQADSAHAGAAAIMADARGQAKDVYLRGYQLRETSQEEAIRFFREVMTMTPPDDEYHQKAKSRLSEIQGR